MQGRLPRLAPTLPSASQDCRRDGQSPALLQDYKYQPQQRSWALYLNSS